MNRVLFIYTSGRERLMDGRQALVLQRLNRGHVHDSSNESVDDSADEPSNDLDELREIAEDAGIDVDMRWRAKRLKAEIKEHVAVQEDDD